MKKKVEKRKEVNNTSEIIRYVKRRGNGCVNYMFIDRNDSVGIKESDHEFDPVFLDIDTALGIFSREGPDDMFKDSNIVKTRIEDHFHDELMPLFKAPKEFLRKLELMECRKQNE
jgi:hypothetical protein